MSDITKKRNPAPKKIAVSISRNSYGSYVVFWRDVVTGKMTGNTFGSLREAQEEQANIRERLSNEVFCGDYDTIETRTRKYIEVETKLKAEKKAGISVKVVKTAQDESGLRQYVAYKAKRIIHAIDDLEKRGEHKKSHSLRVELLHLRVDEIYEKLPKRYKKTKKTGKNEAIITKRITGLARALDTLHKQRGGGEFRDCCMESLKRLSKKFDEWRTIE